MIKVPTQVQWERMTISEKIALCKQIKETYPAEHRQIERIEDQIKEFNRKEGAKQ